MDNQLDKAALPPVRPSFFGPPANWHLWSRMGQRFWGGVLFGIGLGLFVAKFLQELELWKYALVGFIAIALIGGGLGIAVQAARRTLQREKNQPKNQ
jgi:hypothetical protein